MKDLQEATAKICELKGEITALQTLVEAILRTMPAEQLDGVVREFEEAQEIGRTVILGSMVSDHVLTGFDRSAGSLDAMLQQARTQL